MEYITAEQFLEQDEKVQKVFLEWWEPSTGDLYCIKNIVDLFSEETSNSVNLVSYKYDEEAKNFLLGLSKFIAPLLTEGQLRKFIEDKTGFPIQVIEFTDKHKQYEIMTAYKAIDAYKDFYINDKLGTDLLQAYWRIALEIAKESVKQ